MHLYHSFTLLECQSYAVLLCKTFWVQYLVLQRVGEHVPCDAGPAVGWARVLTGGVYSSASDPVR